jgi:hypothetical protein
MADISPQSFIDHLHSEKIETQKERSEYCKLKIGFITSLLGLSAVFEKGIVDINYLLFIIPFVSIVFDYYIAGSNSSIKK